MEQEPKTSSRKKFVLWGLGILSSITAFKLITPAKKKKETVKMLTQDGKLVEIDKAFLHQDPQKKQATKKDILRWIHPARD